MCLKIIVFFFKKFRKVRSLCEKNDQNSLNDFKSLAFFLRLFLKTDNFFITLNDPFVYPSFVFFLNDTFFPKKFVRSQDFCSFNKTMLQFSPCLNNM